MSLPKASIIIPAYNTEAYIAQAIDSALNQTLSDIEVIVVDDASSDRTVEIVQRFSDPRLHLLKNPKNLGVSASRNRALQSARGEWIAVLDSDDWYAPDRLEALIKIAEEQQADLVVDNLNFIQDNESSPWSTLLQESSETITDIRLIDPVFYLKAEQRGLDLGVCKPLFRRSFLNQHHLSYDETQHIFEDFHLTLRCLIHKALMLFVPIPYYFYRHRQGSLSSVSHVKYLKQFQDDILNLIQQDVVQCNPALVNALSESLVLLKQNEHYYKVVEPLKQKKWLTALMQATSSPYFFVRLMQRLRFILGRRYRYYSLKLQARL